MLTREWRNRQTRTFEGRVFPTYGFKSRLPHHKMKRSTLCSSLFYSARFRAKSPLLRLCAVNAVAHNKKSGSHRAKAQLFVRKSRLPHQKKTQDWIQS